MNGFLRGGRGGRTREKVLLAVVLTFLLDGCAVTSKLVPAPSVPVTPAPEQVTVRIQELESQLRKDKKADPEGALAHELALLYVHPENRTPDYGKSLAMIRTYLSLAPPGKDDLETGRLATLLEEIERLGRLLRDSNTQEQALSGQVQALSGQVQALQHGERDAKKREHGLRARIKTLQERIEKIEALDMEMEKRRRSVR